MSYASSNRSQVQVVLSLGGNLSDSPQQLSEALRLIKHSAEISNFKTSSFYLTTPVGEENQSDYINAVCLFSTCLSPIQLFKLTQGIEITLGKTPKPKWAPRLIDIDIIMYGTQTYRDEDLEIPHPRWLERLFVLVPMSEFFENIIINETTICLKEMIDLLSKETHQEICLVDNKSNL